MGGSHSRRKGHAHERAIAIAFREIFPGARRQLEYHVDDCKGVDIQGTGRYKIQCKKFAKYAPITCIQEVECDRDLGDVPVLVTAGDRQEAMAVLPFDDFLRMVRQLEEIELQKIKRAIDRFGEG